MKPLDWAGALVILLPFLALNSLNANPVSLALIFVALLGCGLRGRWAISRSAWWLWSLLGVVVFAVSFRINSHWAQGAGLVFPSLYPVALSAAWACLPALLRSHTKSQYWFAMSLSGFFFLICGLNLLPKGLEFGLFSGLWMILFSISSRLFLTTTRPHAVAWLTLVPMGLIFALLSLAYAYSETQVNFLMRLLSAGGDVGLTFPAQNNLNTMLNSETNPAVVARCFTKRANPYLPARVYTFFRAKTWTEFAASTPARAEAIGGSYRYLIAMSPPDSSLRLTVDRFEVRASPINFFFPRDTVWLQSQESNLVLLSGHLLEQRGGGNELQYYQVARLPMRDLAPVETEDYLQACRQLPEDLDPVVVTTAKEVMGDVTDPNKKAMQCQSWFQTNFKYGFGYDFAGAKDPIAEFLTKKPPAHCELFAATMALMCRAQGIPSRYINGFVCVERAFADDYYVVRVRDAHAWVEIWDGKAWRTYDPTPPVAIQPPQDWGSWFDQLREAISYYTRIVTDLDWRKGMLIIWNGRVYLGVLVMLYLLWRVGKVRWFPRLFYSSSISASSEVVRRLSTALGKQQMAKYDWETLLDWAERLNDSEISQWLQDYSAYRYGGAKVDALEHRLETILKRLQNQSS